MDLQYRYHIGMMILLSSETCQMFVEVSASVQQMC